MAEVSFQFERKHIEDDLIVWETFGNPSTEEWIELLSAMEEWLTEAELRGRRFRLIIDATAMAPLASPARRLFGQWRAQNVALIANSVMCAAYVADSSWLRALLTATFWFAPPVVPVQIVGGREEAIRWVSGGEFTEAALSARPV